jgi:hypothetical protein
MFKRRAQELWQAMVAGARGRSPYALRAQRRETALSARCTTRRRFSVEEDISSKVAIKSSAIRAIKQAVVEQFPAAEEYIDEVVPKKATVLEGKGCVHCAE